LIDVLEDIKGGAERQVYELLRRIDRARFEPFLYVLHQNVIPQEVQALGMGIKGLGLKRIYDFKGIIEGIKFARFAQREKIDVVLTYHFASDIWGTVFGKLGGAKTIISSRRDVGFWRDKGHIRAYKFVNRWVTRIITVSEAVRRMVLDEESVAPAKVITIYNGVDISRFMGHQVTRSPGHQKICHVGNFNSPEKGQFYLIEAFKIVLDRYPEAQLMLVGDGPLLESHKVTMSQSHNVKDKIRFLGKRSDIPEILAKSDVCVLPSLSEGLSNALIEYMAAGKAVVATAVGGNVEVVKDGVNGLLVPAKDPAALAVAIMKLLEDPALAERLGRNARATVERDFEVGRQIGKLMECIEQEIGGSGYQGLGIRGLGN
jgi:glycosyltransferase involved in cell wall biosynthesis